jgi:hypothetical protein
MVALTVPVHKLFLMKWYTPGEHFQINILCTSPEPDWGGCGGGCGFCNSYIPSHDVCAVEMSYS